MDWSLCVICQKTAPEPLRCPLNAHGGSESAPAAYASFLENVKQFRELDCLPLPLVFGPHTDASDFIQNRAHWHKSCHAQFNTNRLARARKRERDDTPGSSSDERPRRPRQSFDNISCIFCTKQDGHLHEFATLGADDNVRSMARDLQATDLLTRIEGVGDLIALEAKYHLTCLVGLRNSHRSLMREREQSEDGTIEEKKLRARVFAELITHIENEVEGGTFHFKFVALRQLYEGRLAALGLVREINKVRFKEKLMRHFPHAQEQSDGKHVILVFEQGMQQIMKEALQDYEGDALILAKAAHIVRKEIFNSSGFKFNASFPPACQQDSIPANLKSLITMLIKGPDLKDQDCAESQACLTVSQTILFNCMRRTSNAKKKSSSARSRHSLEYEPPLPLYIGLNIHTQTRSRKLVTQLYELGLSVSYDRVLQLEKQLATAVCENMKTKGVVCPVQLRQGLFTVGALDNVDHNPSSTTAQGAFHGTGISLFQFPTKSKMGQPQDGIDLVSSTETSTNHQLPDNYTTVPAVALQKEAVAVPKPPYEMKVVDGRLDRACEKETLWLEHGIQLMGVEEELVKGDAIAWSAYHASLQDSPTDAQAAITQPLPLFYEKAATPA